MKTQNTIMTSQRIILHLANKYNELNNFNLFCGYVKFLNKKIDKYNNFSSGSNLLLKFKDGYTFIIRRITQDVINIELIIRKENHIVKTSHSFEGIIHVNYLAMMIEILEKDINRKSHTNYVWIDKYPKFNL